jgi:hypothetical protein
VLDGDRTADFELSPAAESIDFSFARTQHAPIAASVTKHYILYYKSHFQQELKSQDTLTTAKRSDSHYTSPILKVCSVTFKRIFTHHCGTVIKTKNFEL